jgi:hypothetical protein
MTNVGTASTIITVAAIPRNMLVPLPFVMRITNRRLPDVLPKLEVE